jgi:N6-L-threonylcarbamoyladenine synthase
MVLKKIWRLNMKILGVETSCDETSASIIEANKKTNKINLLSNITASSLVLHRKTGGIIPEVAAREQLKYILPVITSALKKAKVRIENVDSIAVTIGPGLIGSLLVGIETAKAIAAIYKKPIIPVNHLFGHIYANFIEQDHQVRVSFPAIVLVVSGGHTDLLLMKRHGYFKWLGGTRDDAAGEAFDKIARLLNLPYPGGPAIEQRAKSGNLNHYKLPRPMIDSNDFDFSFSGLKTAVLREKEKIKQLDNTAVDDLSASTQQAVADVLIKKTLDAVGIYRAKSILLSGGVVANQTIRNAFQSAIKDNHLPITLFVPDKKFCTDNAAMIATAAFFNYNKVPYQKITANPNLYFD